MVAYRFFMLDTRGRIHNAEILEADDDASAVAAAEALKQKHRVHGYELWQGARRIATNLEAPPSSEKADQAPSTD